MDWTAIRRRYEAGESAYRISVSLGNKPTRQGIEKRAKREGWGKHSDNSDGNAVVNGNWLQRVGDYSPVGDKDTPETRALILQTVSEGLPLEAAAKYAGISKDTLDRYRAGDAVFAAQIEQAQQEWHRRRLASVERAADTGDAATGRWLLERHPATRDMYRPSNAGGPSVAIQINTGIEPRVKTIDAA